MAIEQSADMVYQPQMAHWPDTLASFEAFTSIEEGRKHYPEVPAQFWEPVKLSDIEDPTIFGTEINTAVAEADLDGTDASAPLHQSRERAS